jgi:uncharacterized DUF497 family protein
MIVEWDEAKRRTNIQKHGIDFVDADIFFAGPRLAGLAKTVEGEARMMAVGTLHGVFVTAIYTLRGDTIRIISMRRARHEESRQYQAVLASRS